MYRWIIRLAYTGLQCLDACEAELDPNEDPRSLLPYAMSLWGSIFRATIEDGDYDQAFTAMRREESTAEGLEINTETKQRRYSQLSYFVVVLCEKGELDKLCTLPWSQQWGWDEVEIVQKVLREYARFSNVENTEDEMVMADGDEDDAVGGPGTSRDDDEDIMRVDFYRALYAFLIQQGNIREAAIEMYRVYTR